MKTYAEYRKQVEEALSGQLRSLGEIPDILTRAISGPDAPGRSTVPPYSGIAFAIKKPPLLCVAGLPPALISHYAKGVCFVLRYSVFLSNIAAATQNKDPERQR